MSTHKDIPAWQALGFEQSFMDAVARNQIASLDLWWDGPRTEVDDSVREALKRITTSEAELRRIYPPRAIESWVFNATLTGMVVFAMGSLGYQIKLPPLNDWRAVGRRMVAAVVYYFFGPWRDKFTYMVGDYQQYPEEFDRARARAKLPWIDYYREGLTVALSLSDWQSADRLLGWPGPDLKDDHGLDDWTTEDNLYQIWLAARARGEKEASVAQERARIERSTRRRPKMLMAAADALLANDQRAFSSALEKYLRHYRKNNLRPAELSRGQVNLDISTDANTLWHLARRRGLGEVPLPDDLGLLIAKP